jgi:hypothetical protein
LMLTLILGLTVLYFRSQAYHQQYCRCFEVSSSTIWSTAVVLSFSHISLHAGCHTWVQGIPGESSKQLCTLCQSDFPPLLFCLSIPLICHHLGAGCFEVW